MSSGLNFEQKKESLVLRMKLETEKEVSVEKMHQGIELEKVLSLEKMRDETEQAKLDFEKQKLMLIREGESCS